MADASQTTTAGPADQPQPAPSPSGPIRAVVVGGSGQIGGWLLRILAERSHSAVGTYATVAFPGLVRLDASDRDTAAAWIRAQAPDVVFYPAGFTWVDGCEREPKKAYEANLDQPLGLAHAAAEVGARFVYFSTDYVFDGTNGPYSEDAPTTPLSAYGKAKRDAEQVLQQELGDRQLTLRTSWVFGPERQGKNFAYQALRSLAEKKSVVCPSDQISNPSYGPDVARAAVLLAERKEAGLFHVVGPEVMDRVAFAQAIARAFGHDPGLIQGKTTAELNQEAPRPLRGGMRADRLNKVLPGVFRSLTASLEDFRATLQDPRLHGWVRAIPVSAGS